MKRNEILLTTTILILIFSCSLFANGLSLNSVGTRATGMGGAMVGLADDATAIYWNPSGISNVDGGFVGFYLKGIHPMANYSWQYPALNIDINAEAVSNMYLAPNFFATYQVDAWTFGLGVFVPAGLGAEWNGDDLVQLSGGTSFEWMSRIGVVDIAPAVSYKFSDQFSLGLTVNIYYAFFDMKRPNAVPPPAPFGTYSQYTEESTGTGVGVTVGAQYKINEMWTLGATFRSKTTVNMSGTAEFPAFGLMGAPTESEFDREVAFPMWIAGGVAVRPSDRLILSFDVQYSQWSESENVLVTEYKDPTWKAALEADDDHLFVLKWEDATQIRLGAEYLASDDLALRLGYYYDPAPSPDETLNILFPSSTNHVITGGAGYRAGDWSFQLAAEYLFGQERVISDDLNNPAIPLEGFVNEMPGTHQVDIFAWSVGLGYTF
jgi:long-chain fatty acid transport protein